MSDDLTRTEIIDYFKTMSITSLSELWFEAHDTMGLTSFSGISVGRFTTVLVYLEPATSTVSEMVSE